MAFWLKTQKGLSINLEKYDGLRVSRAKGPSTWEVVGDIGQFNVPLCEFANEELAKQYLENLSVELGARSYWDFMDKPAGK